VGIVLCHVRYSCGDVDYGVLCHARHSCGYVDHGVLCHVKHSFGAFFITEFVLCYIYITWAFLCKIM
jgi:hypothetical protein